MRRSSVFRASDNNKSEYARGSGAVPYTQRRRPPVGDADEVMASGEISGTHVTYGTPDTTKNTAAAIVMQGRATGGWENKDATEKTKIAAAFEELRPPYAPKPSTDELANVLGWIANKEKHVEVVGNDSVYQFVYKVAGHVGDTVERLLKHDTTKRRSASNFFGVPGSDITEAMLDSARATASQQLSKALIHAEKEEALGFIDQVIARNITMRAKAQGVEDPDEPIVLERDVGKAAIPELSDAIRVVVEVDPDAGDVEGGLGMLQNKLLGFKEELYPPPDLDADNKVILPTAAAAYAYFARLILSDDVPEVRPTPGIITARELVKDRQSRLDAISLESMRARSAATLDWMERTEVLKMADMNEELFMAIGAGTMLVVARCRGFAHLDGDNGAAGFLVNGTNPTFQSLFANLAANLILRARFFSGQRSSYDRNHERISLLNDRLIHAIEKYAVDANGVISVRLSAGTRYGCERIAYGR